MAVRTLRSYAWTTMLTIVVLLFAMASLRTEAQQRGQDAIAAKQVVAVAQIAANTSKLAAVIDAQCADRTKAYTALNVVLDTLMENVRITKSLPEREKAQRYVSYERARVVVPPCPQHP